MCTPDGGRVKPGTKSTAVPPRFLNQDPPKGATPNLTAIVDAYGIPTSAARPMRGERIKRPAGPEAATSRGSRRAMLSQESIKLCEKIRSEG